MRFEGKKERKERMRAKKSDPANFLRENVVMKCNLKFYEWHDRDSGRRC